MTESAYQHRDWTRSAAVIHRCNKPSRRHDSHNRWARHRGLDTLLNIDGANILDLTNPEIAETWGYPGGAITSATQAIGQKAAEAGYDAIRFWSEQGPGANWAVLGNFARLLSPQMLTPLP